MKNKIWFKIGLNGLTWYPVSLMGWITIIIYFVIVIYTFNLVDTKSHSGSDTLISFAPIFIITTILLIIICYKKGEKPKC